MKIPASSLYFKINGPDPSITRPRAKRARARCRPKPFPLNGFDFNFLWNEHGLSHGILAGRGYFSVPSSTEGALWLQHHGFTPNLLERGSFIGAPILSDDVVGLEQQPVDYVLIPTSEVFSPGGERIWQVLPERFPEGLPDTPRSPLALDIHPICRNYLRDHQMLFWTSICLNADSTVSGRTPSIALHGTYPNGVVPTVQDLERLCREANLDKLLLEHVFVLDSDEPRTSAYFQTLERLALVLPDVQVCLLRPWESGNPVTLASLSGGEDYVFNTCDWNDERWDEEPWGQAIDKEGAER